MRMKLKVIRSLWSGVKKVSATIKSARAERSNKTLALKRLQAKNYVATISDETWNKISTTVFEQKGEPKSIFLEKLHKFKQGYDACGITMPKDVLEAYNQIERKATIFADRMILAKSKGKTPKKYLDFGKRFRENNQEAFDKLEKFVKEQQDNSLARWHDVAFNQPYDEAAVKRAQEAFTMINTNRIDLNWLPHYELYNTKIGEVAPEIIKKGQTFYHGTTHQRAITKNGFHLKPKKGQAAMGSRELGEGVYLTPDKKVSSKFAGPFGGIIHTKVDTKKVAVVNNSQLEHISRGLSKNLSRDRISEPATMELLIKELFQRNGYNAAYTREALGSGIFSQKELVDKLAGGKQSQLVVFDPKDITILGKTLKERLSNQKMQFENLINMPKMIYQIIKEKRSAI